MMATYHRLTTPSSTTHVNHTPHTRPLTVLSSSYYTIIIIIIIITHYTHPRFLTPNSTLVLENTHSHLSSCPPFFPPFPPAPVCVYKSPCHVLFYLPLMKVLSWAETFGKFATIDICPSIYLGNKQTHSII